MPRTTDKYPGFVGLAQTGTGQRFIEVVHAAIHQITSHGGQK